jgi:lipopolysaccharide transport system ATP-binding protein
MNREIVLGARMLGKAYPLTHLADRSDSLRSAISQSVSRLFRRRLSADARSVHWALSDVSFDVRRGENVGIIGLNGAGKSTLLKILSRIVSPTAGYAHVSGRLGALLEVGTGFHPELTGRENTYLYGAILGMTRSAIRHRFDDIVAFAEIARFIDTPVKRYSSGMYVRLAFSVAAHLRPDILLLDEVLSVGDLAFQRKCNSFVRGLQRESATILYVSHNMFSIKTMCERVIVLRKGSLVFDGPTDAGIAAYEQLCFAPDDPSQNDRARGKIRSVRCELRNTNGERQDVFDFGEQPVIRWEFIADEELEEPGIIFCLIRSDGTACCNFSSEADEFSTGRIHGRITITATAPPLCLVSDAYQLKILVRRPGFQDILYEETVAQFHVRHDLYDGHFGVFHQSAEWEMERAPSNLQTSHAMIPALIDKPL